MKIFLYIFLIILSVSFYSCTSPTEVDAHRKYTPDGNGTEKSIHFDVNTLLFEDVMYNSIPTQKIKLYNDMEESTSIKNIFFKYNPKNFYFVSQSFPINLAANGNYPDEKELEIAFKADSLGYMEDTLFVQDYPGKIIIVKAEVPQIKLEDIDFGEVPVNETKTKTLTIYNFSDRPVALFDLKLKNQSNIFKIETETNSSLEIEQKSSKQIIISFTPKTNINYTDEISHDSGLEALTVDKNAVIRGKGI